MSTATDTSKFGIGLDDPGNRERILAAYRERPWLTAIHAHVGSQGCPLELIGQGIAAHRSAGGKIDAQLGRRQMTTIDIGGGLPVNFAGDAMRPSFADYAAMLRGRPRPVQRRIPRDHRARPLGAGQERLHPAKVEYTKTMGGRHIAITHAGAQVATRTVFMPELWPIRISALDPQGRPKTAEKNRAGHSRPLLLRRRHHRPPRDLAATGAGRLDSRPRHRRLLFLDAVRLQQPAAGCGAWLRDGGRRRRVQAASPW